jgi:ATP-dependent exoDNAse (exonuclease V) beta subunit
VLDAVNAVFEDTAALESLLPGATKEWEFTAHEAANKNLTGAVQFFSTKAVDKNADKEGESEAEESVEEASPLQRATAALLKEIDPLSRGLSCAVLMRSNTKATALTGVLRSLTGMNVVTDSKVEPITDNAVTLAFLSLLQLAAHPADTLALEHLCMTPLAGVLGGTKESVWNAGADCSCQVFEKGFASWVLSVLEEMRKHGLVLDAFHQRRVEHLLDFASGFDESGSRDIDLFLQGARAYTVSQLGAGEAIQVMTIHKSKGLEFDVVILPDLGGTAMDSLRARTWVVKRERGDTQWVIQSPEASFVPLDEVLSAEAQESKEKGAFESLCRLYVAMTRAKRGLYFIGSPPPAKPKAVKEELFLRKRLLGAVAGSCETDVEIAGEPLLLEWQTGDAAWYLAGGAPPVVAVEEPGVLTQEGRTLGDLIHQNQSSQRRRTPSGEESFEVPGKVLFSPGRDVGRHLGSRVHELMAEVDWWVPGQSVEPLMAHWRQRGLVVEGESLSERALALVLPLLESEAGRAALLQPEAEAVLWREKPFDFIDAGDWVSGVFDRVVLERDADGQFVRGQILDFKTDEAPDEAALQEKAAGYAPQLALYRRAVARLTGLAETQISTSLVFLRALKVVGVEPEGRAA